ncbi:MAG: hypothetical protein C0603_02800 [Denitrovibrio sp.]|nr:MAG: hypothetical protein C0603_02800 [Denitrovibrio sp.]
MKNLIILMVSIVLLSGCMTAKKKTVVMQDSAKAQQMKAAQADAEMDRDIESGNLTLTPPPTKQKPVLDKPSAMMPPTKKPMKLGSLKPQTKYPLKGGFPVWFYTPVYDGYIGAVGIAPKQPRGGFTAQKRVARMQAQKNLAKQINVLVKSEVRIESLGVDSATVQHYREKITSLTREQVDQYLTGFRVQDEWIDEKTSEYYMWMVLER